MPATKNQRAVLSKPRSLALSGTLEWSLLYALLGALAITLGARISFPLPGAEVPQSGQTLAVLLCGLLLGPRLGFCSVGAYVALGTLGLPVFADGRSGLETVVGSSAGYLLGFFLATALAGIWVEQGWSKNLVVSFLGMALAHAVVLFSGWLRLSAMLGGGNAFATGVAPFIVGGLVKSLIAAGIGTLISVRSVVSRRLPGPESKS